MKLVLCLLFLCSQIFADHSVLGLGTPCIDYIYRVDDSYLQQVSIEKEGWKEVDWETFSKILQTVPAPLVFTGGSCANTMKGLAALGIKGSLIGSIGSDTLGERLTETFNNLGILPYFFKKDLRSSQIACFVTPDGARTFCAYIRSEKHLSENDLTAEMFSGAEILYVEGYRIFNGQLVERAMNYAREVQAQIAFDIGNSSIANTYRERILAFLSNYVNIVFANEEEAYALTRLPPKEACLFLKNFCDIAVVKVGKDGCWVATENEFFHSPGFLTKTVDTTGAGDIFASAFLYGYLNGIHLKETAKFANKAGSIAVENFGAELGNQKWEELKTGFEQIRCKQSIPAL